MNLKEAASRLDVHYQTAYKWIRSGELVAVKVGSRYDISDAAIEKFLATRLAAGALVSPSVSTTVTPSAGSDRDVIYDELESVGSGTLLDLEPTLAHMTRRIAETSGDLCMTFVMNEAEDGPAAISFFDPRPRRLSVFGPVIAALASTYPNVKGPVIDTFRTGASLLVPHLSQDGLRKLVPTELHQYLDDVRVFSLVAAPIVKIGRRIGGVTLLRDYPDPFTHTDERRLIEIGRLLGTVVGRAREDVAARLARAKVRPRLLEIVTQAYSSGTPINVAAIEDAVGEVQLPISVIDAQGFVVAVNEGFRDFSGYGNEEIRAKHWSDLVPRHAFDELAAKLGRLVTGELDYADFVTQLAGKHETFEAAFHSAAVRDPDATVEYIMGVGRRLGPVHPHESNAHFAHSASA